MASGSEQSFLHSSANKDRLYAKGVKPDHNSSRKPSCVLLLQGFPSATKLEEIVCLCPRFGNIKKIVLAKEKSQAFLKMGDMPSAQAMMDYFILNPPSVRSSIIYVHFSRDEVLRIELASPSTNQVLHTVLSVIIDHLPYSVTVDDITQVFSPYGKVIKIVTWRKDEVFHARIQYSDTINALNAKNSLHGQSIYGDRCTVRIVFSKRQRLRVQYKNDMSRDYTKRRLPFGKVAPNTMDDVVTDTMHDVSPDTLDDVSPDTMDDVAPDTMGDVSPDTMDNIAVDTMDDVSPDTMDDVAPDIPRVLTKQVGSVLSVTNLNEKTVTCDALFVLFGVYGDVIRVRIMHNKKGSALIQFCNSSHAERAMAKLDNLTVWGKQIRVGHSKHEIVQMRKEGERYAGLTTDYTWSPLHRFRKPTSISHQNIFAPSAALLLYNIPPSTQEDLLRALFVQHGEVVAFELFKRTGTMAWIQMGTTEEAVHALMATHHHKLAYKSYLGVFFSGRDLLCLEKKQQM